MSIKNVVINGATTTILRIDFRHRLLHDKNKKIKNKKTKTNKQTKEQIFSKFTWKIFFFLCEKNEIWLEDVDCWPSTHIFYKWFGLFYWSPMSIHWSKAHQAQTKNLAFQFFFNILKLLILKSIPRNKYFPEQPITLFTTKQEAHKFQFSKIKTNPIKPSTPSITISSNPTTHVIDPQQTNLNQ